MQLASLMHKLIHSLCVWAVQQGMHAVHRACACSPSIYEGIRLAHCVLIVPALPLYVVSSWCCACGRCVAHRDVLLVTWAVVR